MNREAAGMDMKRFLREGALIVFLSGLIGLATNVSLIKRYLGGEFDKGFVSAIPENAGIEITMAEAEDLFVSGLAFFIDARTEDEFRAGHIPRAKNIPYDGLTDKKKKALETELPNFGTLVIYCSGGDCRSSRAMAGILVAAGFKDVRVFAGGWSEWTRAGLPTEAGL
jgi:rhodanese-related sulfurtransferase